MRPLVFALSIWLPLAAHVSAQTGEPAYAEAEAGARELFERGVEQIRLGRWPEAEALFRASQQLVSRPSTLYNLALSLYEQHRARESLAVIAELMARSDPRGDARYREYAETLRERARAEVAVLEVRVGPADAQLTVDGVLQDGSGSDRTLVLDPGTHRVAVRREGFASSETELRLAPGERVEHAVDLARIEPAAAPAPQGAPEPPASGDPPAVPAASPRAAPAAALRASAGPNRALSYALLGTAGAALVAAAVTGALAADADAEFVDRCGGTENCDPELRPIQDRASDFALATDVLLVGAAGLGLSGLGLLLFATDPDSAGEGGGAVRLAPGAVAVRAGF